VVKHAVQQLFEMRLARSTKAFTARGGRVQRCDQCRIDRQFCICTLRPSAPSNAAFLLLYYDDEVLKPSNSGRLIADLFSDTFAYIWQRTEAEPALLALLKDPIWRPIVVFPQEYATPERELCQPEALIWPAGDRCLSCWMVLGVKQKKCSERVHIWTVFQYGR